MYTADQKPDSRNVGSCGTRTCEKKSKTKSPRITTQVITQVSKETSTAEPPARVTKEAMLEVSPIRGADRRPGLGGPGVIGTSGQRNRIDEIAVGGILPS
ncbi:hypothetical protein GCM10023217_06190 [Gordonia alkaliphila]|uniref:Uncharacterized protein n=1 Tax=Gordonia alkaliphila TaxID=1053547 RepID=A0ABP8YY88_9ACTN